MKRILLFLIFMMAPWTYSLANDNTGYEVTFYEDSESSPKDETPEGERMIHQPIFTTLTLQDGIAFQNFNGQIVLYVIEDALTSSSIASFTEECDFIDFIFTYSGEVCIRLITEFCPLVGYVNLNSKH